MLGVKKLQRLGYWVLTKESNDIFKPFEVLTQTMSITDKQTERL